MVDSPEAFTANRIRLWQVNWADAIIDRLERQNGNCHASKMQMRDYIR
jgi:hypothetical protein